MDIKQKELEHEYINLKFSRPTSDYKATSANQRLSVNNSFNSPILKNVSDYKIAIAHASLFLRELPLLIGENNKFKIGLYDKLNGNILYEQYIIWDNEDPDFKFAGETWIYTHQKICDSINNALASLGLSINTANPGTIPNLSGLADVPRLFFDHKTCQFHLVARKQTFEEGSNVDVVVGVDLFDRIFNNFEYEKQLYTFSNGEPVYKLNISEKFVNWITSYSNITPATGNNGYYDMWAEYANPHSLCEVHGIRIKLLNIAKAELIKPTSTNWTSSNPTQNIAPSKVLQDLILFVEKCQDSRGKAIYIPQIFHWHDIKDNTDISNLNIEIAWFDAQGNEKPYVLPFGKMADIKFIFKKR